MSVKCRAYSLVNHEMGTSAHPMFLSVLVSIMSVRVLMLCMWLDCEGVVLMHCGCRCECRLVE